MLAVVLASGCDADDPAPRESASRPAEFEPGTTSLPCDGADTLTVWIDADGDGFPGTEQHVCAPPPGSSTSPGEDCDDADPFTYPGAWDAPGDGVDRSCDGEDADGVSCGYTSRAFPGDLVVDAAEDLDGFCFDYNGVDGDLVLTGGIDDVAGLYCLCHVYGDLRVEGTHALVDLAAIADLAVVSGHLRIVANTALVEAQLGTNVYGDAEVADNPVLEWGPILSDFTGHLDVRHNPALLRPPSIATGTLASFRFEDNDAAYTLGFPYGSTLTQILGDLVVTDNAALVELEAFPVLAWVGGDLIVERNASLVGVRFGDEDPLTGYIPPFTLGGDLSVRDNPALLDLLLEVDDALADVAVERNDVLPGVGLFHLRSVTGDLLVADNPMMWAVGGSDFFGGAQLGVDGDVVIARNGSEWSGADAVGFACRLERVGGDLFLTDVPSPPDGTYSFTLLDEVSGDLVLEGPHLAGNAFPALSVVGGSVRVTGSEYAVSRAFPALSIVGGDLEVVDDPVLTDLSFPSLDQLAGSLIVRDAPGLVAVDLPLLAEVPGALEVSASGVGDLSWASAVAHAGSLTLSGNPALADVTGFYGLDAVDGDVTLTDNPILGDPAAFALVAEIDAIGGAVLVEGNGP